MLGLTVKVGVGTLVVGYDAWSEVEVEEAEALEYDV